jgi:uncharacterized protein (DUF4415 family)
VSKKSTAKPSKVVDWKRLDRLGDDQIDYSDIPALEEEFFAQAEVTADWPPAKKQLTLRVDADVLDWLRASGRGYHTRINRILRIAMDAHIRHESAKGPKKKVRRAS